MLVPGDEVTGSTGVGRARWTLYLGGQPALDRDVPIVPGRIVEQFRGPWGNELATLAEESGIPEALLSVTICLTDIPDYRAHGREFGAVWARARRTRVSRNGGDWHLCVVAGRRGD
jgi:enamine deaminase RidA (YjgF/YER057c/UK114 family)